MHPFNALAMWMFLLPPPDMEVSTVIAKMGHEKQAIRNKASQDAAEFGFRSLRLLEWHSLNDPDPEIRIRCRRLISQYYVIWHSHKDFPHMPWLDSLPKNFYDRNKIIDYYTVITRQWDASQPGWPEYRHATGLFCRDLLTFGVPKKIIVDILDKMTVVEKIWRKERNYTDP